MRAPMAWLRSLCDPGLEARELSERLSMTGTEVERVLEIGAPSTEGFVVGAVLDAEQHPNADRLRVCTVDTGEGEPRTIVCGAPNVAAGQTVAVAFPGAVMPGGTKLGKAKLRGIESAGMILSETEMELGEDSDGIAVLETDAAPGTPLAEVLPITETVLELEITPNRADCFGLHAIGREVHAITGAPLAEAPWETDAEPAGEDDASDHASVAVEVPELCPRFTARVFEDVTIAPSPLWLKARLIASGQRPINNVVDITNYVMLLTGQPLHAFDLDEVPGGEIIVRAAAEGEKMTTLDDVERTLDADTVVVCDRNGPSGIAGIMGGQISEVSEKTTRVLLEAANWDGFNILRSSGFLGLRSEASTRFEKGIHPDLTMRAQAVASKLLVELCGARLVPGTIDVDARLPRFEPRELTLRAARVESILGMPVSVAEMTEYLERLGFAVSSAGDGELCVGVPADRHLDTSRLGTSRLGRTGPSGLVLVAQTPNCDQVVGFGRVQFDLGAQSLHVDVQRLGVAHIVTAPHPLDQLGTGEDSAGIADQRGQQVELLQRELDLFPPDRHHMPFRIQPNGTSFHDRRHRRVVVGPTP